jgi:AcrR family transcriptional regulator
MDVIATSDSLTTPEDHLFDAALTCLRRWGVGKTTIDDVARTAGVSRATVYRLVPGGRDALFTAVAQRELSRFVADLRADLRRATDLEDVLVRGITGAARRLRSDDLLATLVRDEPETLVAHLAFDRLDPLLAAAVAIAGPELERFLPETVAGDAVEWAARLLVSHLLDPSDVIDLADEADVRPLVATHLLPGIALAVHDHDHPPTTQEQS